MPAFLEVFLPSGREIRSLERERCTIGRQPSNDVVLDDDEVSRVHAVLELLGPAWLIRDLSSRNGTRLNGQLIAGDRRLTTGDELRIGGTRLLFRANESGELEAATRGAEPTPELTRRERDVLLAMLAPAGDAGAFAEPAGTREIAATLVVSEAAVKQHLANLYEKFGIHTGLDRRRLRLANEALRRGVVSLAEARARHGDGA